MYNSLINQNFFSYLFFFIYCNYKVNKKIFKLSKNLDIFLSYKNSILYLKGFYGVISLKLPSYYFLKYYDNNIFISFLKKNFFISFIKHFFFNYNRLFLLYCIRLRIKGLGYRIRKISENLYYIFFNYTNMFYINIPNNILFKWFKKRIILLSNDLFILKLIFSNILLLKKLGPYRLRGLRYPKQIILIKKSGKRL